MKKILLSLCFLMGMNSGFITPVHSSPLVMKTQIEVKNAHKGMISVITYNKEGNLLHSGYGFFIQENGVGIAAYSLFKEAHKAVVVDYKGNQLSVARILGASSTYDLVKFSIETNKEVEAFTLSSNASIHAGDQLQMARYTGKKKAKPILAKIQTADVFEDYQYYKVAVGNNDKNFGCPLLNQDGEVVAIVQKNVEENAEEACAIDARFVQNLNISSTSILNSDLNNIYISKGLPANEKDALTYLYMIGSKDSIVAMNAVNDFIQTYPKNAEGYVQRATIYAQHKDFARCQEDFNKALEVVDKNQSSIKADEIHNNLSKLVYNKVVFNPENSFNGWTLDFAIEEAQKAFEINPSPFYLQQQAHCYLAKKEYLSAFELYKKINSEKFSHDANWSPSAKAESWVFAARAYEMHMKTSEAKATREDSVKVIALLDSAILALPQPYILDDAKLFLEKAQRNEALALYRKAVLDYYEYEKIIGPKNLNDKFYYIREQAEMKCHMYQQALDDINTAIAFNPQNPFYPVEKGIILLQVGMYKEAIDVCEASLKTLPENPDCYKIIGISYGELKNKKEALKNLKKAQDLGDPTVKFFIEKYQ